MSTSDRGNQSGESCRCYSLAEIQWATHNFDDALLIGKGGFGKVYKGIMYYGAAVVAIKRLNTESKQGAKEFWSEIKTLSMLRHPHLVTLIGYCDECKEMILVYEYMANGTLADHLYNIHGKENSSNTQNLTWGQRLQICINAACGLDYLHNTEQGVIHRDVKTTNILLNKICLAKISDLGLSKMGIAQTHVSTDVKGTFGYLDPEYFLTHRLTKKSDVYAFGVVLFEVLCARPPVDIRDDDDEEVQRSLPLWAQQCMEKGMLDQIIDPYLRGQISPKHLKLFVEIANKCLHKHPQARPTMAEVEASLQHILASHRHREKREKRLSKVILGFERILSQGMVLGKKILKKYGSKHGFLRQFRRDLFVEPAVRFRLYRHFKLAEIEAATNEFHENLLIGDVGYTKVYRGHMGNAEVAIRRWKEGKSSERNLNQFTAEIQVQPQLHHLHIVRLIGYCNDNHELILVYEYMVNKSLHHHLFGPNLGPLPWVKRLQICLGAARGLQYLHTGTRQTIIHHNLKPSSILLDENWAAKLSSLEFSVVLPTNGSTATFVAGNVGYMDSEYLPSEKLTIKSDVYSFGVVLLEVLCGRKTMVIKRDEEEVNLVRWFKTTVEMGAIDQIIDLVIDPVLIDTIAPECLKEYLMIAENCVRDDGIERPSMDVVVGSLCRALQLQEAWLNKSHEAIPHFHNRFFDGDASVGIPGKGVNGGMSLMSLEDSTYLSGMGPHGIVRMDPQNDGYFTNLMQSDSHEKQFLVESQYFNPNAQVLTQETQFRAAISKKQQHGGNFTIEEDKLLVSAWLNISMERVQGNDQKKTTFWQRVKEFIDENMPFESNRTEVSLLNRWSIIQLCTNKFCSCYTEVESLNRGVNEEDKMTSARDMYKKFNGTAFQFEHCWVILKNQPKWFLECEKKNQLKTPTKGVSFCPPTPNVKNLGDDNVVPDVIVDLERPSGKKAEKLKKKKNKEVKNSTQISGALDEIKDCKNKLIDKNVEMLDKTYEQEQEKIQIEQEMLAIKKCKEEERVIMMDLSGLSEEQQEFYTYWKREILEKKRRVQ